MSETERSTPGAVAVVGAGLAGLTAARRLRDAGRDVVVFDKSHGVGGRTAGRRVTLAHGPVVHFPHGCQTLSADRIGVDSSGFAGVLQAWERSGVVTRWRGTTRHVGDRPRTTADVTGQVPTFIGTPAMTAPAKRLADGLDVRLRRQVTRVSRDASGWRLEIDVPAGEAEWPARSTSPDAVDVPDDGPFDTLVVALPADQAAGLLGPDERLSRSFSAIRMLPQWCLLAAWADPASTEPAREVTTLATLATLPFDAIESHEPDAVIRWASRAGRERGNPPDVQAWVAHACLSWSAAHVEQSPDAATNLLLDAFGRLVGVGELPPPAYVKAHRWRYSSVESGLGRPCLVDADRRLAVCGDWCLTARAAAAWASGHAAAEAILAW